MSLTANILTRLNQSFRFWERDTCVEMRQMNKAQVNQIWRRLPSGEFNGYWLNRCVMAVVLGTWASQQQANPKRLRTFPHVVFQPRAQALAPRSITQQQQSMPPQQYLDEEAPAGLAELFIWHQDRTSPLVLHLTTIYHTHPCRASGYILLASFLLSHRKADKTRCPPHLMNKV